MKIEFQSINKSFNQNHVLKDVSFTVHSGQMFGYLGRNGAGKTTSIRILMDLFKADSGKILVNDQPFHPQDYRIGYLPEERGMYAKSTIRTQLIYFATLRGATTKEAKETVEFWAKKFQIEEYLDRKLETLSKGNQQKVQITQAFLNNPDILILDEPFSGLDPVNSKVFQDALSEYISDDRIIIFSSHQMNYIESFCDSIAIINHGEIVLDGKLSEIKKELGMNKIRLQSASLSMEELANKLSQDLNIICEKDTQSFILTLPESLTKNDILSYLLKEKIEIQAFLDFEPSLQDIFINKVGDHHETV